jgi:hypothetical protein
LTVENKEQEENYFKIAKLQNYKKELLDDGNLAKVITHSSYNLRKVDQQMSDIGCVRRGRRRKSAALM